MTVRPFPLRGPGHTGTVPGVALLSRPIGGLPEPSGHQTHLQTGEQGDLPDAGTLPRPGSAALLTRCQGRCRPAGAKQPRLLQTGEAQGPGLHPQSWGVGGVEMKDHGTTSNTVSTGQQSGGGTFRTSKRPLQCQYPHTHTPPSPGRPAGPRPDQEAHTHGVWPNGPSPGERNRSGTAAFEV